MRCREYFIKRRKAFGYAFSGVWTLFKKEAHAKIHLVAGIMAVCLGFICDIERWEWCVVLLCIGGVIMAEGFNTAIEAVADKVSKEKDPLIKIAKDVAAGAVLVQAAISAIVGLLIFLPHIF